MSNDGDNDNGRIIEDWVDFTRTHPGEYEREMVETPSWTVTEYPDWQDTDDPDLSVWMPWADDEYSWSNGTFTSFDHAKTIKKARDSPYLAFIHQPPGGVYTDTGDDLLLADFDDCRDPESGEVIPEVYEMMERFGLTYTEISKSGTGIHPIYKGSLPEGYETGFTIKLRDEPVYGHDEPPKLELWDRKRANHATGERVDGTPREAQPIDEDELLKAAEKHGKESSGDHSGGDAEDWDPNSSREEIEALESTSDMEDIYDAIKHTTVRDIRLKSEKTEGEPGGRMSFDPSWEHSESGTRLGYEDGAWIYRKGNYGLDALQVVALEEGLITDPSDYPRGKDFWDAVEVLRERGAPIPDFDESEPDPLSMLPLEKLDALPHQDRVRYAKKHGIGWPNVDEVRDRLKESILDAMESGDKRVTSSPTGSGKTHAVATERWRSKPEVTNDQPVVHAHRTREARNQARQMSEEAGVDAKTLKGRKELCPVAGGHHDPGNEMGNEELTIDGMPISEWMDHRCERQGMPFSHVHQWAGGELDVDLPCQRDDTDCAALTQFNDIPRRDNGDPSYDVIHCTHQFLHVPSLRMHTNVVVDEKPNFGIDLEPREVRESVNAYLDYVDAPVGSYSELVQASKSGSDPDAPTSGSVNGLTINEHNKSFCEEMDEALSGENTHEECPKCDGEGRIDDGRDEHHDLTAYPEHAGARASDKCPRCSGRGTVVVQRGTPPLAWYKSNPDAHALAPAFAKAIWQAEESSGDRKAAQVRYRPPRWGNHQHDTPGWNRVYVEVVLDDQWEVVEAEQTPDVSLANSVIGLDAHPQEPDLFWTANLHPSMDTEFVLDKRERALYRRYERGLFTVQVGHGVQPVASGEWLDDGQGDKFRVNIEQLRNHYGEEFDSAITSAAAKPFVRSAMEEAGVEDPDMMHYGNEESRNDFAGKEVGLVAGSIDPGDDVVMNLCARMGLDVDPAYKECPVCEGTGDAGEEAEGLEWCDTCSGDGQVRERGRTFEGEDAEKAEAVLKSVREHHVAQSAGRWARDAEDPDDHATVFIITEAAPVGFIDAHVEGATWTTNNQQREILETVRDNDRVTAKEVAESVGCPKQTAWRTLKKATEKGLLERHAGAGAWGADLYAPMDAFTPNGAAEVDAENVTNGVQGTHTYSVMVDVLPNCAYNAPEGVDRDWPHQTALGAYVEGGPPPG